MNFQTSLPYATDSDLHVIEGLDITGTPIYQRTGLDRFLPVDMYTLLQGIIERCLATQNTDGTYLVSPIIFSKDTWHKVGGVNQYKYEAISKWIERTYPGGVLNEVTGYVENLMDMYPKNQILQAIDDKLWELGSCSSGVHDPESCYGNLSDTPPYWEAFRDITYAMTQAGVGFDPVSYEMVLVPARASSTGSDQYGAPDSAVRIYPEMLIARYKVMQQLRYIKAGLSDTRRYAGGWGDAYSPFERTDQSPYWPSWWTWDYVNGRYKLACQAGRDAWAETVGEPVDSSLLTYWLISRGFRSYTQSYNYYRDFAQGVDGYGGGSQTHWGPKLTINGGYTGISHDVKLYGYWDGGGDHELWQQFGGDPLVLGKNLIFEVDNISGDTVWQAGFENPENELHFPPFCQTWPPGCVSYYINKNSRLSLQTYHPINDWKFEFCKHSDFGGDVTWHV